MRKKMITADRLAAFSDGIFAVALTVMVLELKAPLRFLARHFSSSGVSPAHASI
jgi:uncharacterized membrane protein